MADFTKIDAFVEHVAEKVHNLGADVLTLALSTTAPTSDFVKVADIVQTSYINIDFASNLVPAIEASAQTNGTYKLTLTDTVITASGGTIGPFRYVYLYNDTATSDELICYWDYGSEITLNDTETFTVNFDTDNGVLQIASSA